MQKHLWEIHTRFEKLGYLLLRPFHDEIMTLQPGDTIEKYVIDSILGEGGMAVVYKVHHQILQTPYALKIVKIFHPKTRERMIREGKVQARIHHKNVVQVIDILNIDGYPGLVMEYIDGCTLDKWLDDREPNLEHIEEIFVGVLHALTAAHSKGIIHRDLKPSNIMLDESDGSITPKVCDFGLAKAIAEEEDSFTRSGVAMGTPAYMSPEQIRNTKRVDHLTDIFSLGSILYEILTGRKPFTGNDSFELFNAVIHKPHVPPTQYVKNLPQRFSDAIDGALTKDPQKRIQDCETFKAVLLGQQEWNDFTSNDATITLDEINVFENSEGSDSVAEPVPVKALELHPPKAGRQPVTIEQTSPSVEKPSNISDPTLPGMVPKLNSSDGESKTTAEDITVQIPSTVPPSTKESKPQLQEPSKNSGRRNIALLMGTAILGCGVYAFSTLSSDPPPETTKSENKKTVPYQASFVCQHKDLSQMDKPQLRRARAEISAKYGKAFADKTLQSHFQQQPWYQINPNYNDGLANQTDQACLRKITDWESNQALLFSTNIDMNGDGKNEEVYCLMSHPPSQPGNDLCEEKSNCEIIIHIGEQRHQIKTFWKDIAARDSSKLQLLTSKEGLDLIITAHDAKSKPQTKTISYDGKKIIEKQPEKPKEIEYATVSFSGARRVRLVRNGKSYSPGKVPPGRYTIYANFDGTSIRVNKITLKPGQKRRYRCNAAFLSCE